MPFHEQCNGSQADSTPQEGKKIVRTVRGVKQLYKFAPKRLRRGLKWPLWTTRPLNYTPLTTFYAFDLKEYKTQTHECTLGSASHALRIYQHHVREGFTNQACVGGWAAAAAEVRCQALEVVTEWQSQRALKALIQRPFTNLACMEGRGSSEPGQRGAAWVWVEGLWTAAPGWRAAC
eukprot:scaffold106043_cov18-Tisochrysis_lutea.AAC.4